MNIGAIIDGWAKVMRMRKVTLAEQDLSKARLIVCSSCEYAKESSCLEFINDEVEEVKNMYCTKCLCPWLQKSLTNDLCPLGKWDNIKP